MSKTIGILTAGGDCAGLNAVISSIVKVGTPKGYDFVGFHKGWEGVLTPVMCQKLDLEAVRGIGHLGGTILGTTNHGRFAAKVGRGEHAQIDPNILKEAKANLDELGIDGLIVVGGDGTLAGATQLAQIGVKIVGVPKTIDNDLSSTDVTFGFSSAVSVAVDALDKIHTTATSHDRVFFVECMGRTAGWITLYAGLATNANAILIPEFKFDIDDFIAFLQSYVENRGAAIIAVAEGMSLHLKSYEQAIGSEVKLAGASNKLMSIIEAKHPGKFEMRNVILGHTQRGGGPNAEDRILAKRYGIAAFEAYAQGKFNHMVRLANGIISAVPIASAVGATKLVTKDDPVYKAAVALGLYIN